MADHDSQEPRVSRRRALGAGAAAVGGLAGTQVLGQAAASAAEVNGPVIVVCAADAPASIRADAHPDYLCDNAGDEVQINLALSRASATPTGTIGRGTKGGLVLLVGRRFTIDAPILVPTQTALRGQYGKSATWIYASASFVGGATTGLIQNATANAQYIEVSDLGLNGANRNTNGIALYTNAGQEWDSFHVVRDVYIMAPGLDGLRVENAGGGRCRGNHFSGIRVIDAGQDGVYVKGPDSFYERVDVGSSGRYGFNVQHSNNRFVNCKAWFSVLDGFLLDVGRDNQLSACESQDNARHGFNVSSPRNSFAACCADSNGRNTQTGDGFYVDAPGNNIHGTASDKHEAGRTLGQRYGVQLVGSPKVVLNVVTSGNFVGSSSGAAGAGSVVNVVDY